MQEDEIREKISENILDALMYQDDFTTNDLNDLVDEFLNEIMDTMLVRTDDIVATWIYLGEPEQRGYLGKNTSIIESMKISIETHIVNKGIHKEARNQALAAFYDHQLENKVISNEDYEIICSTAPERSWRTYREIRARMFIND